jgi:6-phosphogluconolactonase
MSPKIKIFKNPLELADSLAKEFIRVLEISSDQNKCLNVALSGGTTPKLFFEQLAHISKKKKVSWEKLHLFWGDERCVPPDHKDSNFGMTKISLFDKISIPEQYIHRILGEENPEVESKRYEVEIKKSLPTVENIPCFDWIILGIGTDGHTASLFPNSESIKISNKICAVATYPGSEQKRITITLPVINNAKRITFLVAGDSKAQVVDEILNKKYSGSLLPASLVNPTKGILEWYLDEQAAKFIC